MSVSCYHIGTAYTRLRAPVELEACTRLIVIRRFRLVSVRRSTISGLPLQCPACKQQRIIMTIGLSVRDKCEGEHQRLGLSLRYRYEKRCASGDTRSMETMPFLGLFFILAPACASNQYSKMLVAQYVWKTSRRLQLLFQFALVVLL